MSETIDLRHYLDEYADFKEALELVCVDCVMGMDLEAVKECESLLIATKEHREGFESKLILCLSDRHRGTLSLYDGKHSIYKDLIRIETICNISKDGVKLF